MAGMLTNELALLRKSAGTPGVLLGHLCPLGRHNVKIEGLVWNAVYHHDLLKKGVKQALYSINQPMGKGPGE